MFQSTRDPFALSLDGSFFSMYSSPIDQDRGILACTVSERVGHDTQREPDILRHAVDDSNETVDFRRRVILFSTVVDIRDTDCVNALCFTDRWSSESCSHN